MQVQSLLNLSYECERYLASEHKNFLYCGKALGMIYSRHDTIDLEQIISRLVPQVIFR